MLNELNQDASGAPGVKERDEMASRAGPGLGVDELDTRLGQDAQVFGKVLATVGDVMKAGPAALEESGNGGVRSQGLDQLHLAAEGHADALAGDGLRRGASASRQPLVQEGGFLE